MNVDRPPAGHGREPGVATVPESGRGGDVDGSRPLVPESRSASPSGSTDRRARGRLKIYFGYTAGVGKTRAMFRAAEERAASGIHVMYPCRDDRGSGTRSRDAAERHDPGVYVFDVDDVLRRRPELFVVPLLARRNPDGSRHRRRYQDVQELLEVGIDVWSTLEVAQIESLADLVAPILGGRAHDTVPDSVFDEADEVAVIDVSPEELVDLVRSSATPMGEESAESDPPSDRATFVALRELALRRAADRLNARGHTEPDSLGPRASDWRTAERLLVCVGPSPTSGEVIRACGRMARSIQAPWVAAYSGRMNEIPERDRQTVHRHLRLAESLGAETVVLPGGDVPQQLVAFAKSYAATRIVVGKSGASRWSRVLKSTVVDRVIEGCGDIDVCIISGAEPGSSWHGLDAATTKVPARNYAGAAGMLLLATGVAWSIGKLGFSESNLVLAYLLGVTAVAVWFGRGPAVAASFGAVLLFNFFFTSPYYTFRVHDSGYVFTFAVMLVIGLLVSTLTSRIRDHSTAARLREQRTEQLYQLSRQLSATTGHLQIVAAAESRLAELLDGDVRILLPDDAGRLRVASAVPPTGTWDRDSIVTAAQWAFEHAQVAGSGTETHSRAPALCLPLVTPEGVVGVLAVCARDPEALLLPDRRRLVETFAAQVGLALARDRLTERVHRSLAQAETERLRSSVLSSVSHDFRSPLAAIAGASSSLLSSEERIAGSERRALLQSIYDEADRLARLVDNLLHMTRLESGQLEPRREWNIVEDLVGSSLTRLARDVDARPVTTDVPADLPLIYADGVLIESVLTNLIDNATKYSPAGAPIEIRAWCAGSWILLEVADRGPGLRDDDKERVFEKFYRGTDHRRDGSSGAGLGLAICAAVARLHGGDLRVADREGGGARFILRLPLDDQPPAIELHDRSAVES